MPWNGSGMFNRIYSWVADKNASIDINASRMDTDTDDIVSAGLGNCVTRDGQGQPNASIIPLVSASYDLGSNSFLWRNGWFSGSLTVGGVMSVGGVTSTGVTGTGNLVYSVNPALTTPSISGNVSLVGVNLVWTSTSAVGESSIVLRLKGTTPNDVTIYAISADGENGASCAMSMGKNSSTGRSINAGGTINASGADYAEYETKAEVCGQIAKGQIIGFDKDGCVTDKFADAISFGIKSSDPSYVGGDAWGSQEALGISKPVPPEDPGPDVAEARAAQYQSDLASYTAVKAEHDAAIEAARQKVDRIAYSGKVPVNIIGASVGDYIFAVQDGDAISGQAVTSPTFDQYRAAVGRVRKILPDGRCVVAVIVH